MCTLPTKAGLLIGQFGNQKSRVHVRHTQQPSAPAKHVLCNIDNSLVSLWYRKDVDKSPSAYRRSDHRTQCIPRKGLTPGQAERKQAQVTPSILLQAQPCTSIATSASTCSIWNRNDVSKRPPMCTAGMAIGRIAYPAKASLLIGQLGNRTSESG